MSDSNFLRLARRVKETEDAALLKSGGVLTGPITTPNNAVGINIGDDARFADRNVANTLFVEGNQNNDRGYINFSQYSGNALGAINGGNLTWRGNRVWDAAALPYETGTWTPTLYGSTTAGTPTYAVRAGTYTRIGNRCLVSAILNISAKGGMVGTLRISGLPFLHAVGCASALTVGAAGGHTGGKITLQIDGNTNYASLQKESTSLMATDIPGDAFALWGISGEYQIKTT